MGLLNVGGDAARLLALLAGDGAKHTFQTFDETQAKRKRLTSILHGTLEQRADELHALNADGASVNFMVNEGDGKGRATSNVVRVRAVFVDLDGPPLDPVLAAPLQPHAVVQTSPGKYHAYWAVDDVALEDFGPMQRALAARFQGDRSVADLPRVMRLPGFTHNKLQPVPCTLLAIERGPRYSRDQIVEAFGLSLGSVKAPKTKLALVDGSIPEGERNTTLFSLARGFVNKGLDSDEVLRRIQLVNVTKCVVPLCAKEVDAIVDSALSYGPSGFLNLPLQVFDSQAYRRLSHSARTIAAAAYRRYNGENNGNIALPFSEFTTEFSRKESFYKARKEVEKSGLLRRVKKHRYHEWAGRQPDLYEVALGPPSEPKRARSAAT